MTSRLQKQQAATLTAQYGLRLLNLHICELQEAHGGAGRHVALIAAHLHIQSRLTVHGLTVECKFSRMFLDLLSSRFRVNDHLEC